MSLWINTLVNCVQAHYQQQKSSGHKIATNIPRPLLCSPFIIFCQIITHPNFIYHIGRKYLEHFGALISLWLMNLNLISRPILYSQLFMNSLSSQNHDACPIIAGTISDRADASLHFSICNMNAHALHKKHISQRFPVQAVSLDLQCSSKQILSPEVKQQRP